jgi:hypothetical protein
MGSVQRHTAAALNSTAAIILLCFLASGAAATGQRHHSVHHKHSSHMSCEDHGVCNTVPVPDACTLALRQHIAWGVSTAAYQVLQNCGCWEGREPR